MRKLMRQLRLAHPTLDPRAALFIHRQIDNAVRTLERIIFKDMATVLDKPNDITSDPCGSDLVCEAWDQVPGDCKNKPAWWLECDFMPSTPEAICDYHAEQWKQHAGRMLERSKLYPIA